MIRSQHELRLPLPRCVTEALILSERLHVAQLGCLHLAETRWFSAERLEIARRSALSR